MLMYVSLPPSGYSPNSGRPLKKYHFNEFVIPNVVSSLVFTMQSRSFASLWMTKKWLLQWPQ